ncbi:MAG: hypothetical protein P9L92_17815 [Candidatus Electryonea clarkiae]|nr:hypothetical protein [Candidatus Electryonea clarkiae]MDP8287763.1 hypothetical protein [Candidatus Electryonea clarkiae]
MNNWLWGLFLIALTVCLSAIGCSEDDKNPSNSENAIENPFALEVGNWWIYEEYGADDVYQSWWWNEIVDTTTVDGKHLFLFNGVLPGRLHEGDEGLYFYDRYLEELVLFWKFPASAGDTYYSSGDYPDHYERTTEVISTNSSITVPAGTFDDCYEYSVTTFIDDEIPNYYYLKYYFKPTIGLIYRSQIQSSNVHVQKLERYNNIGGELSPESNEFADRHWNEEVYRGFEYWLAFVYQQPGRNYLGSFEDWQNETWETKLNYLPTWFTNELSLDRTNKYYIFIGLYTMQFGIGWEGAHDNWDESDPWPFYQAYFTEERHLYFSNEYLDQYLDMW